MITWRLCVGRVTQLWAPWLRNHHSIPGGMKKVSFFSKMPRMTLGPTLPSVGTVDSTPGDKATKEQSWPHTSIPLLRWRMSGTILPHPPYLHFIHMDNFIFTYRETWYRKLFQWHTFEIQNLMCTLKYQFWSQRGKRCMFRIMNAVFNLLKPSGNFTYHQV
jgi:hypothetical protein